MHLPRRLSLLLLSSSSLSLLPLIILCERVVAHENNLIINNIDEFLEFSANVSSGTSYNGTTILLGSDVDFEGEEFNPIGNDTNCFSGTFNGQGHVIKNLVTNSSQYVGLFGYSTGLTIKNVVIDSSCSIVSTFSDSSDAHVGGIIGYCETKNNYCNIENSVNIANVTFNGSGNNRLYLGGIVGSITNHNFESHVKNCANYGSVTHSSMSGFSYVGCVIGRSSLIGYSYSTKVYIRNCLNYGTVSFNGMSIGQLYLGGIAGYISYTVIENCVSYGSIISIRPGGNTYVGGIVGNVQTSPYISYCYWSENIQYDAFGLTTSTTLSLVSSIARFGDNFELNETISVGKYKGTSLIDVLNAYSDKHVLSEYSKWILNKNKNTVSFTINGDEKFSVNSQITLLPSLASEGLLCFDGWYTDGTCTTPLKDYEIGTNMEFHGKWGESSNNYTITFDTRGGTPIAPITAQYTSIVPLQNNTTKNSCTFIHWESEYDEEMEWNITMPARNITLRAVWLCTRISSAEEFVDFANFVNSGTTFKGTTVFLGSDIDFTNEFSEQFQMIGMNSSHCFFGTFDGQGHIISSLVMNLATQYYGLFGYSNGLSIRNVVIDNSCAFTNSYSGPTSVSTGGIIGYCSATNEQCNIENSVNMANVTFSGNSHGWSLYFGGIAGTIRQPNYGSSVRNCANYGSIANFDVSGAHYIGGIIGYSYDTLSIYIVYIQNCLNHGSIYSNGTRISNVGGIIGCSNYVYIENCVNTGNITCKPTAGTVYVGSIVGYPSSSSTPTNITHCFWTGNVEYNVSGESTQLNDNETTLVSLNSSLADKLNKYSEANGWNEWLLNMNNASVTFKINNYKGFALDSQIILLPNPTGNYEYTFSGWYSDEALSSLHYSSEVESDATLYGMFCGQGSSSVVLDVNGGNVSVLSSPIPVSVSSTFICSGLYGPLPSPTRTGHTFDGWFTEREGGDKVGSWSKVTGSHDTLYAHWTPNKYTVTFDVNGGDELDTNTKEVTFNDTYGILPKPNRGGCTFIGWVTENNESVTDETIVTIAKNHTLYAQWNNSNQIEIVFNTKDLTKEDIEKIVEQIVGSDFEIVKYESNESGEIRVVIKFIDSETANNFVEEIKMSSGSIRNTIKTIGYVPGGIWSFSIMCCPTLLLNVLMQIFL